MSNATPIQKQSPAAKAADSLRDTFRTKALCLDAWDRLFGKEDKAAERQERRDQREQCAEVERAAQQRL